MVWLSVNPNVEEFRFMDAALALASTPDNELYMLSLSVRDLDPVFLAECYNNAESLGLDLFSIKRKGECRQNDGDNRGTGRRNR